MPLIAAPFQPGPLALAVARRRAELGFPQDLTDRGGPSESAVQRIEKGPAGRPRAATLRRLDEALGWPAGTAHAFLHHADPPAAKLVDVVEVRVTQATGFFVVRADDVRRVPHRDGDGLELFRGGVRIAEVAPHTWVNYELVTADGGDPADAAED